jgi:neutral ceramidase
MHMNRLPRFAFAAWFAVFLFAQPAAADELRAGAAVIDITPPTGHPMWGYAARHDAPSTGVLDPLRARAVVLEAGKVRMAIVSLDLGRAPVRQSMQRIEKEVKQSAQVNYVLLVASHTHHGPVIETDNWPTKEKPYTRDLEQKLIQVITDAAQMLQPARFGIASKPVDLNRNRHSKLAQRPVDSELIVLRLETPAGKPIAHLVNFAAHPTMHPTKLHKFSADYPGAMAALVEKETAVPCLFLQGAAGDLSPNPGKARGPDAFGQVLGKEVLTLSEAIRCERGAETSLQVREHTFQFKSRFDLSNPLIKTAFILAFYKDIVEFYEREYREGVRPRLTVALLDGKIGLVGVSGEFFCEHALSLKQRARLEHLLFFGYCNDYQQYFPTIQAVAEGGYGADPEVAPVEVGAGEQMMNRALIDLFDLRGQIRKLTPGD